MEYAEGGDLLNRITSHMKHKTHFEENEIWRILSQMVLGLKALHDLKIVHRDIKCANVFQTKEGIIKLGDLNVSKIVKVGFVHTQTGTPYYASPEIWKDKPYDYKSDMWSLGALLYELCCLSPPFKAQGLSELAQKIMSGKYSAIPKLYSEGLSSVIKSLLQVDPQKRANCDLILINPNIIKVLSNNHNINLQSASHLIETIKVPRNLKALANNLPKPNYQNPEKEPYNRREIGAGSESEKNFPQTVFEPKKDVPNIKQNCNNIRNQVAIKQIKDNPVQKQNYLARPFYANNQYISPNIEQNFQKHVEPKRPQSNPPKKIIEDNKLPLQRIIKSPIYAPPQKGKFRVPLEENPCQNPPQKALNQVKSKERKSCENKNKNNLKENINYNNRKIENIRMIKSPKVPQKYEMYDKGKMLKCKNNAQLKKC